GRSFDKELPMQLHMFFLDLSRMLSSSLCDEYTSESLDRINFELGYITLPVLSEVAVTWRCNIKCQFCYASCRCVSDASDGSDLEELSTSDMKRVLEVISREAEVPSVSFTGGEPALRSDLSELIAYAANSLGMRVNLITNGTLISDRLAKEFKASGLASAQVSIESPDEAVHDELCGVKGAFKSSLNGFNALKNAGVPVHPHSTLCRSNKRSLLRMPQFARSLGADRFSLNMIIPAGRGINELLSVKYSEVKDIILDIQSAAYSSGIEFMWYSPTPLCLFNPISHQLGNKGCSACEGLLSIDPFGRMLPCSSWKEPLGNLLQEGFETLWFGERGQWLREKRMAHPNCRNCDHFAVCHGACPLYFKAYGYEEIAQPLEKLKNSNQLHPRSLP
ncbi:MAG: radical SAM protein, partial [Candidatus Aminicenantes bacterium]|nr:radical SAM protein [Candidatus Aminicenantes bacterium]